MKKYEITVSLKSNKITWSGESIEDVFDRFRDDPIF